MNISNLDSIDHRLLGALDQNARLPFSSVARLVGLPEETVRYRYQRLLDRKVILSTFTVIDAGKLGYSYFKLVLKLHNVSASGLDSVRTFLCDHSAVNWVAQFDLGVDLACTIRVRHIGELSDFVDALRKRFSQAIATLQFAANIEVEFFPRHRGTTFRKESLRRTAYSSPREESNVDEVDRLILTALSEDARTSASHIARSIGMSTDAVLQRIRKLEKSLIITGYRLVLNAAALGEQSFYLLLYLRRDSEKRVRELVRFMRSSRETSYLIKALGQWDYEASIEVPSIKHMREFKLSLLNQFSDVIQEVTVFPVGQIYKLTLAPGIEP